MIIRTFASAELCGFVASIPGVGGTAHLERARGAACGFDNGTSVELSTSQDNNSTGSPPDRHSC